MPLDLIDMIELGDSDELIREIDRRSGRQDWDGLVELRDRCRAAVDRGKQLWGAAAHAEYRLALEAPADYAAAVVDAEPVRFALGPLSEVAASSHTWVELAPHLPPGPLRAVTAYERVVRGEEIDVDSDLAEHASNFEMPFRLEHWEPNYEAAEYRATEARFAAPLIEGTGSTPVEHETWHDAGDVEALDALRQLVTAWTNESNGSADVVAVEGGIGSALTALEAKGNMATRLTAKCAISWMAWAAASGGAHGRRRGAAHGRAQAWWALAAVAGIADDWPVRPDELGAVASELEWWTWDVRDLSEGWSLRLIATDHVDGVSFGIDAFDRASLPS